MLKIILLILLSLLSSSAQASSLESAQEYAAKLFCNDIEQTIDFADQELSLANDLNLKVDNFESVNASLSFNLNPKGQLKCLQVMRYEEQDFDKFKKLLAQMYVLNFANTKLDQYKFTYDAKLKYIDSFEQVSKGAFELSTLAKSYQVPFRDFISQEIVTATVLEPNFVERLEPGQDLIVEMINDLEQKIQARFKIVALDNQEIALAATDYSYANDDFIPVIGKYVIRVENPASKQDKDLGYLIASALSSGIQAGIGLSALSYGAVPAALTIAGASAAMLKANDAKDFDLSFAKGDGLKVIQLNKGESK